MPLLAPCLAFAFPDTAQILEAIPVILSLIVIEGLLSVDNALAIAAMASHLPGKQKQLALKLGIIGAYVFRGLALLFASAIAGNLWVKVVGAAYLIYLMCEHFTGAGDEDDDGLPDTGATRGFFATVVSIEVMDLSLSVDNVVAAIALSPHLWVVCTGVFIGILALRFLAGYCIGLIEKFPELEHTAFLLIGYVGGILVFELATGIDIHTTGKFVGIVLITAATLVYSRKPALQARLAVVLRVARLPMAVVAALVGGVIKVVVFPFRLLLSPLLNLVKRQIPSSPKDTSV